MRCKVLLYVQYNVNLYCLFSSWFAKEVNVANNAVSYISNVANEKRESYKCCKPGNDVTFSQ